MIKIKCKICNKEKGKQAFGLHLKTHDVNFIDYIEKNLEQFSNWRKCENCGKLTKQKVACNKSCMTEIRKTRLGCKAPRYGASLSKQSIDKMKKTKAEGFKQGKYKLLKGRENPASRPEVRKKISQTLLERDSNKGKNNGMYGKTHSPEAIKKIFSYRKMNTVEKLVADFLDKNNIDYHFQFFINENSICKSYDFKIKDKPLIIEVDGDFWHGGPGVKKYWKDVEKVKENDLLKEQLANSKGYKVIRFWQSELKKDINIISQYL